MRCGLLSLCECVCAEYDKFKYKKVAFTLNFVSVFFFLWFSCVCYMMNNGSSWTNKMSKATKEKKNEYIDKKWNERDNNKRTNKYMQYKKKTDFSTPEWYFTF